ncbi:MAG TPA: hypothetical protein DET40_07715 [Lentisphaeria bacterium]|nr:MAG: hypothetical protein A2X45_06580 [Lentisphaerae bacterium GWF2_50_93]HCE43420.1 hypothetical protein [Lentisphaeria bacterium]
MKTNHHCIKLLGLHRDSPDIQEFIRSVAPNAKLSNDTNGKSSYAIEDICGLELSFETDGTLYAIFMFREPLIAGQTVIPYKGPLPFDISFDNSKESMRSKFGEPFETGELESFLGMTLMPRDKWLFDDWTMHLHYTRDLSSIGLVTIVLYSDLDKERHQIYLQNKKDIPNR